MAGLYLHIPFCKKACHYCDFHFSVKLDQKRSLTEAMMQELQLRESYLNHEALDTIYFGGGTPSLLDRPELEELMASIHKHHRVVAGAEVALEANPDDLHPAKLKEMAAAGINRLSIGIQSFDDAVLAYFNRAHSAAEAMNSFRDARAAGFANISIDLIYGIPGQTQEDWAKTIRRAVDLGPEHISAYALTIEEKTVFGKWKAKGNLTVMDEEGVARHLEFLMEELSRLGYEHYEISNFSRPGFQSRHNSSYWKHRKYVGIGPSAHSYDGVSRQFNVSNNQQYMNSIAAGQVPYEREELSVENKINEFIMTRLRTSEGCDLAELKAILGYDMEAARHQYIQQLANDGLARLQNEKLTLTNKGKLLADKITLDLFVNA